MIPTTADDRLHELYVSNIIATWELATPSQLRQGFEWYPLAHQLAELLSEGHGRAGAGVIAALSANKAWPQNVKMATSAFETGTPTGHVRDALGKAERIMSGEDPETVLPMALKTGNFYRCISDPTDPDAVVIDRHAHDVAVGTVNGVKDRGLSNKRRYATLAHAYREAARRLGELPMTVQAITWVVQTDRLVGVGFRSSKSRTSS